ncbi:MAG TPA: penicillin-binding protein activator [Steroidobacteraceae bacterium]|nr:penicillin-binding protein activator [Steroidobacteraceae bacterium]
MRLDKRNGDSMLTERLRWVGRGLAVLAATLLLTGCPSLGPREGPPPSQDRARNLERTGDYAGAAAVYERLAAQNTGTEQNAYWLLAARDYLRARRPDDAQRVLASIAPPLAPDQTFERQMLGVELALARGQGGDAWQQLAAIQQPTAPQAAIRYLTLRQQAAFATSRPVEAVRAEMARERYLVTADERTQARTELLFQLRDAQERGVRVEPRAVTDPIVRGWLELAPLAAAAARGPATAQLDIQAWTTRYPTHPAADVVRSELLGQRPEPRQAVPHVALLLPLSGRTGAAGTTVRDGFMTAYYQMPVSQRPRLRIYDTAEISAAEAIARARAEGAEFIVGPLTRDEVTAAADLGDARPPILALNFLPQDRPGPQGFYQFALSPEEEARAVARRILADGGRRGVAVVPEGDWGTRVLAAFRQELEAGGGVLLADVALDSTRTDWAPEITQVLRISDSRARARRLESILGTKLAFEPRRRADLDFIFAPASAAITARLVRPQLRFHFAGDVPTYATSDAFEPDPNANQDMDGLMFPDMPWMLGSDLAESVRAVAREAWPTGGPRRNRLFAFGFDAFRLCAALRSGAGVNFDGLTGHLTLDSERRVHRELAWAELRNGQARLLPPPTAVGAQQAIAQ